MAAAASPGGIADRGALDAESHPMKSRKSFLLRITPELYEALEAWAQQEFRSVNGQIEYLLKEAVRKRGRLVVEENEPEPGNMPSSLDAPSARGDQPAPRPHADQG